MFTAERHASLQNDDAVLIQLGGVLSGLDLDLAAFRQVFPMVGLALDVEDAFLAGEPMTVRARSEADVEGPLPALVVDVESREPVARATLAPADGDWQAAEVGPFPEGAYRVTVFGEGIVEPVTDVFAVFPPSVSAR